MPKLSHEPVLVSCGRTVKAHAPFKAHKTFQVKLILQKLLQSTNQQPQVFYEKPGRQSTPTQPDSKHFGVQ